VKLTLKAQQMDELNINVLIEWSIDCWVPAGTQERAHSNMEVPSLFQLVLFCLSANQLLLLWKKITIIINLILQKNYIKIKKTSLN
jgi:hypothetical protein